MCVRVGLQVFFADWFMVFKFEEPSCIGCQWFVILSLKDFFKEFVYQCFVLRVL